MNVEDIDRFRDQYEARLKQRDKLPPEQFLKEHDLPHDEQLLVELRRVDEDYRFSKEIGDTVPPPEAQDEPLAETEHLPSSPSSKQIGSYKLLQPIGEGGMGTVFMAEQVEPVRRKVALKIIKPGMDSRQVVARFDAERQALAMMDHQNIAKVFDAGTTDRGLPFFVMELVKGIPITTYCDDNRLTINERLELFVPLCHAIQHAHQKGIIHRDIKPSNILVCNYDGQPIPKVIDFGVAKAVEQRLTEKTMFTQYGQVIGTLEYMSPEQAGLSQLDVDTRSDIYSLGVLLYELLTGSTPLSKKQLKAAGFDEMMRLIREEEPPRPSTRLSGSTDTLPSISARRRIEPRKLGTMLRGELDWIVMRSLEKDRTRRYETAISFAQDVRRYLSNDVVEARPPSTFYRLNKVLRRHSGALAAVGLVLLALTATVGTIGWSLRDRAIRQALAQQERDDRKERLSDQVEGILDEMYHLESEQKWDEALAAGRRAEAVAASGTIPMKILGQLRDEVRNLEFLERLDEIRMRRAVSVDGKYDEAGAIEAYALAFRDFGFDVDTLPTEEAVSGLRKHVRILRPLAAAIDDYRDARQEEFGAEDDETQKRLESITRQLDPPPVLLRVLSGKPKTPDSQDELRQLAQSIEVADQSPAVLVSFARHLHAKRLDESEHELLKRAQRQYPGDFWINHTLAETFDDRGDLEGAVRFYTAAVATRPSASVAYLNLGGVLSDMGRHLEAVECVQRAIELDPNDPTAHYILGLAYARSDKLTKAESSFQRAIALDPNDAEAHTNLGVVFVKQSRTEEAEDCYRHAIHLQPSLSEAHFNLGSLLREQGRYQDAEASYRTAIELDSTKSNFHLYLGRTLAARKTMEEAEKCFRRAIELDSSNASAHNSLGVLCYDQQRSQDAESSFRAAIEIEPTRATYHFNLGNALVRQGKLGAAEESYLRAIDLNSDQPATHYALARVLVKQKQLDAAESSFRRAIALDATNAKFHISLADALKAQSRLSAAEEAYRRALELESSNPTAHNTLGILLFDQQRHQEAETYFRNAVELDSNRSTYHFNLGNALAKQDKLADAEQAYRRAIGLDSNRATIHNALGQVLSKRQQLDAADSSFRRAIELDAINAGYHSNLGNVLKAQEKLEEAERSYRKAVDLDPNYLPAHIQLGLLAAGRKAFAVAESSLRRAIALKPKDWQLHYLLGVSLRDQGKLDAALASFSSAIEIDPSRSQARKALGQVLWDQEEYGNAIAVYSELVGQRSQDAEAINNLAWWLVTCPDERLRDPDRGVQLASRAIAFQPANRYYRNTLGVAQYAAGNSEKAIEELTRNVEDRGEFGYDAFVLAMAHWKLDQKDVARQWFDRAIKWVDQNAAEDNGAVNKELNRFHRDAAALLGMSDAGSKAADSNGSEDK